MVVVEPQAPRVWHRKTPRSAPPPRPVVSDLVACLLQSARAHASVCSGEDAVGTGKLALHKAL